MKYGCNRPNGQDNEWFSQSLVNGSGIRNAMISGALLSSNNTYTHIAELARLLDMEFFCKRAFYNIQ